MADAQPAAHAGAGEADGGGLSMYLGREARTVQPSRSEV